VDKSVEPSHGGYVPKELVGDSAKILLVEPS
jgi:hypothetical protein